MLRYAISRYAGMLLPILGCRSWLCVVTLAHCILRQPTLYSGLDCNALPQRKVPWHALAYRPIKLVVSDAFLLLESCSWTHEGHEVLSLSLTHLTAYRSQCSTTSDSIFINASLTSHLNICTIQISPVHRSCCRSAFMAQRCTMPRVCWPPYE